MRLHPPAKTGAGAARNRPRLSEAGRCRTAIQPSTGRVRRTAPGVPTPPRPVTGGEHGRQVRDPERSRLSAPAIFARKHVVATAIEAARRGTAGVVQLGEVGGRVTSWSGRPSNQASSRRSAPA